MTITNRLIVLASLFLAPVASANSFKLGAAVPADSFVYVHGVHNPKSEFIYQHWDHVIDALANAHIDEEIKQLILSSIDGEEDRKEFEALWTRIMGLIRGVTWGDLCHHEIVFYMRMQELPEFAAIMRPKGDTLETNVKGLTDIFNAISEMDEDLKVATSTVEGAKVWSIAPDKAPIGMHLVRHDDVLGIYITPDVAGCVSYMSGNMAAKSLVNTPRYKSALQHVPAPEDSVVFFDAHGMMSIFKNMISAEMPGKDEPAYAEASAAMALFDHIDVFDYIINTERTQGLQNFQHTYTAVRAESMTQPMIEMFNRQGALPALTKYVPADSTGFMAWSGVDLEYAYDAIIDFMRTEVPDGKDMISEWEREQVEAGFDLKKDLLSWISGQFVGVELPAAVVTPGMPSSGDAVLMIKVRDGKMAMDKLNGWVDQLNAEMGGQGGQGMLMISDATGINAEGFRSINHPMVMAMGISFAYGVKDDWLMFGMGGAAPAINKCLASMDDSADSFLNSARFKKEGVESKDPPMWVSFTDLTSMGQELSMAFGFLPMATAFMPPTPETQPVRSVFNILGKMAPAMAEINFMVSEAVVSSWNGKGWDTTTKVTYKEYTPRKKAADKDGGADMDGL